MKNNGPPRVENIKENPKFDALNQPTMSAQPTNPQTIQQTPLTHQRVTRNNKPAIITPKEDTNLAPPRHSARIHACMLNIISQEALNSLFMLSKQY